MLVSTVEIMDVSTPRWPSAMTKASFEEGLWQQALAEKLGYFIILIEARFALNGPLVACADALNELGREMNVATTELVAEGTGVSGIEPVRMNMVPLTRSE